jgi:hypothetical protein
MAAALVIKFTVYVRFDAQDEREGCSSPTFCSLEFDMRQSSGTGPPVFLHIFPVSRSLRSLPQ